MSGVKKRKIYSELAYLLAIAMLSFSVAMVTSTNFGMSMVVAPAYIISQKLGFLSFGQCEYLVQGTLFIVLCIIMGGFKPAYLMSFVTGLIYGTVLDFWRTVIPFFNPAVTAPGSMALGLRLLFFALGIIITGISLALFFRSYLYAQVYEFFVKSISYRYGLDRSRVKTLYDYSSLALSVVLSLLFFGRFVGVGVGTFVLAAVNGRVIGFFDRLFGKIFDFVPLFPKFSENFDIQ